MNRAQRTMTVFERRSEGGQVVVLVLLVLGIFLLAVTAFGVDFANFWFHRQMAQTAADAACTAGAMDLLVNANIGSTLGGFPGGDFDCASTPGAAPCQYAALNGYNGAGTTPGNTVQVSFVPTSSIPGVDPAAIPGLAPNSIQVEIIEHVQTFFSGLLTGNRTQDVRVRARCGVLKAAAPVPLTVLNPSCPSTLDIVGSSDVTIVGGPSSSIQVNSTNPAAVAAGTIDLDTGGPNFTGSFIGVTGGPTSPTGTFLPGTTGGWRHSSPISDPFAQVAPPAVPALSTYDGTPGMMVLWNEHGCPDHSGCFLYPAGKYTHPIVVKNRTVLFVPGVYYFAIPAGNFQKDNCGTPGGCIARPTGQCNYALDVDSNGVVRMSTDAGDGSKGVTFYFSGAGGTNGYGSTFFGANAGKSGGRTVDAYNTLASGTGVKCPGGTDPNPGLGLPATVQGNVLLGPCTMDGTYFASATNGSMVGDVRGMLFFQDRANGNNDGQPSMQGGGGLLLSGNVYFHHCPNSLTTGCNPATDYRAFFQLQGTPGSGTFLLGNITTDELVLGGNGTVSMQLDTRAIYTILKATLLQ